MLQKGFEPALLVDEHGDYLFRYALMRLRDKNTAEDIVQETLLAVIKSGESYKKRSSIRTWLTSILKNKIMDYYRKKGRENLIDDSGFEPSDFDNAFMRDDGWNGFWNKDFRPLKWNMSPEASLEKKDFYRILGKCIGELPARFASAFAMRELNGLKSNEICDILDITPSNFWVIMHRSRASLRKCLELNWFQKESLESGTGTE